ncbi:MAG: hypothetical protein ABFR53_01115 [Actinomycetota bacterium]
MNTSDIWKRDPNATMTLRRWAVLAALLIAGALMVLANGQSVSAASTRVLVDGETFPDGFTIPAGEIWEFDPDADAKVTTSGNVIVLGTLRMRPNDASVEHFLQFTGIDESKFVGGGHSAEGTPNDIGLWVQDAGLLDIAGTPVTPWSYQWESDWSSTDDIVAAPNTPDDFSTFTQVDSAADVPPVNDLGYGTELLNLTRNVRIEGTEGGRTHILIHAPNAPVPQTIEYLAIRYVAPWFDDTDVTGRYGLHLHHNADATAGTMVTGVVVRDADNHAFVPHASHGITFTDSIAYGTTGEAFWWDRSSADACGGVIGCNETNDVVYDSVVVADTDAPPIGQHTATAMWMGGGENLTVTNSVVVGMSGGWGTNASAFGWPNPERGVWNFTDNIAHNNHANGIFVWQNTSGEDDENHVVEGFTAYYNGKAGIEHGAYGNAYVYKRLTLLENATNPSLGDSQFGAIESHALGKPSFTTSGPGATDTQEWNGVATGGAKLIVLFHATEGDAVRFLFCDFSEVVFLEGSNGTPGGYDFIECGLDVADFDRASIDPDTVIRVQDGGIAYQLIGNGPMQSIAPFYDDPQPPVTTTTTTVPPTTTTTTTEPPTTTTTRVRGTTTTTTVPPTTTTTTQPCRRC